MCLLSVGVETLGLLLRVWLWISVPMAVIILLVATWMNYLRNARSRDGLKLAVEGLGGEILPGNVDNYIRREDVVGEGEVLLGGGAAGEQASAANEEESNEVGSKVGEELTADEEELMATGKETIYRGILWMKEKFEHYREQADRQLAAVRVQLDLKQGIIDELEAQLRSERMKVEELVAKLQDKSVHEGHDIPDLGK
jgi:hypothetical protein